MKKLTLATLFSIMLLISSDLAKAAGPNQILDPDESTFGSPELHYRTTENSDREYLVSNVKSNDALLPPPQAPVDPSQADDCLDSAMSRTCRSPRWIISTEAIILNRVGNANRVLVERVPGDVAFSNVPTTSGMQALNSDELHQGFSAGPKISVTYQSDPDYGLEFSYFQILNWNTSRAMRPDNPPDWLVMRAPGGFFQTQDFTYQAMAWDYATELYNAEVNVRKNLSNRVTALVGFRWVQLTENLQGTLVPPDRFLPLWKLNPNNTLLDVAQIEKLPGMPSTGGFPPFWNTRTSNNLYGIQIGMGSKILEQGRFSIDGQIKAGGYYNNAEEST